MKLDDNNVIITFFHSNRIRRTHRKNKKISPEFLFYPNPECEDGGSYGCGYDNKTICKEVATSTEAPKSGY